MLFFRLLSNSAGQDKQPNKTIRTISFCTVRIPQINGLVHRFWHCSFLGGTHIRVCHLPQHLIPYTLHLTPSVKVKVKVKMKVKVKVLGIVQIQRLWLVITNYEQMNASL